MMSPKSASTLFPTQFSFSNQPIRPLRVSGLSGLFPGGILEPTVWTPGLVNGPESLGQQLGNDSLVAAQMGESTPGPFTPAPLCLPEACRTASWQEFLLLNLFPQPVIELCALQVPEVSGIF